MNKNRKKRIASKIQKLLDSMDFLLKEIDNLSKNKTDIMSEIQLSTELGVSKRTLANYRKKGILRHYKPDGAIFYFRSEVEEDLKKYGYDDTGISNQGSRAGGDHE